jgi:alkanesulfonate monooxygenase SsuD/methylene tetrahydromethanopterin reductase-like flavin-dependent oxidoreductase (luciferase family)
VHGQWTEDVFSHAGEHYVIEECRALPKPLQRPHPPLIVGGRALRRTVEPAARFADEYNTVFASPDECRERRARVVEACERVGRDPATMTFSLMTRLIIGSDRAEVLERARRVMTRAGKQGAAEEFVAESADGISGTPEQVVEQLRAFADAGVERVFLQHLDHADVEAVALLGAQVVAEVA